MVLKPAEENPSAAVALPAEDLKLAAAMVFTLVVPPSAVADSLNPGAMEAVEREFQGQKNSFN